MHHLTSTTIHAILRLADILASNAQVSKYVKYCNECRENETLNGGKHEIYDIFSFVTFIFTSCMEKSLVNSTLIDLMVQFYQLTIGAVLNFECRQTFQRTLIKIGKLIGKFDDDAKCRFIRNLNRTEKEIFELAMNGVRMIDLSGESTIVATDSSLNGS